MRIEPAEGLSEGIDQVSPAGVRSPLYWALLFSIFPLGTAHAHGRIGKRFIPTLFEIEDPFVAEELTFLLGFFEEPAKGGEPAVDEFEVETEFAKRITPRFALSAGGDFRSRDTHDGPTDSGFGNLDLGAKYQFLSLPKLETVASFGVNVEIGKTGKKKVEASRFSTISPALFYGAGAGFLPDSFRFLRPIALTGLVSAHFPSASRSAGEANPISLSWGFALHYSIPYLDAFVMDTGLPDFFNRFVPVLEVALETCIDRPADCEGGTSGTVNPGFVWLGSKFEVGFAARVPINDKTGDDVGVFGLVHLFIDDMFPKSLGRPIWPRP